MSNTFRPVAACHHCYHVAPPYRYIRKRTSGSEPSTRLCAGCCTALGYTLPTSTR